ncbi:MAG TPA: heavy-metal-associated domain-containing protein [Treponema sp.]|nr:heavy-metal-associated domain-containing protein [Treponema sp.]
MTKTYQMETFSCPSCVKKIEALLKATAGISESEVLFNSSRVKATFDEAVITSDAIKGKIDALGFKVLSEK